MHTRAGDDQVAHTGQARKGLGLAAHGDAQSGQLGVAAGDERGLGVVTVAQAQRNADSQRNDVLDRTAQLGAAAVIVGVDAEGRCGKDLLHGFGGVLVGTGGHDGGGHVAGDLLGVGRAGQCHNARFASGLGKLILDDLAHRHQGLVLDALGDVNDQLALRDVRRGLFCGGTHKRGRYGKEQDVAARAGLGNVGGVVHCGGQLHTGQVGVAVRGA